MTQEQYYTAPSQEIFDSIKRASIALWLTYDDTYQYATKKVERIKDIENVKDNWGYLIAMFDYQNQQKLLALLDREDAHELVADVLAWNRAQLFSN